MSKYASDCPCCCRKYTAKSRACVTCPNHDCGYECCADCVLRYLGDSAKVDCMACHVNYDLAFLTSQFGKTWVQKKMLLPQAKRLYEIQKTHLSQHQEEVRYIKLERQVRQQLVELRKTRKNLTTELELLLKEDTRGTRQTKDRLYYIQQRLTEIKLLIDNKIQDLYSITHPQNSSHDSSWQTESNTFKCPGVGCDGWTNEDGYCTSCESRLCTICQTSWAEGHCCKKEDIDTLKMIQTDSRQCPGCKVAIHKIEGCDQMWCPKCHTAFSWNTGRKEHGIIHNPHYYQWRDSTQRQLRNVGDVACGGVLPSLETNLIIHEEIVRSYSTGISQVTYFYSILACVNGFNTLVETINRHLDIVRESLANKEQELAMMRVRLLLGDLTEETFIKGLVAHLFTHLIQYEKAMILETTVTCLIERLNMIASMWEEQHTELSLLSTMVHNMFEVCTIAFSNIIPLDDLSPNRLSLGSAGALEHLNQAMVDLNKTHQDKSGVLELPANDGRWFPNELWRHPISRSIMSAGGHFEV